MSIIGKKTNFFLRLLIGSALIFALLKIVPYQELVIQFRRVNPWYLYLAGFLFILEQFAGVFKWKFVLNFLGIPAKYKDLLSLEFSGRCLNLVFPSCLAQDVFRGSFLSLSKKGQGEKITVSIVMDRFIGALGLIFVVTISFVLGQAFIEEKSILIILTLVWAAVVLVSGLFFTKTGFNIILSVFKKNSVWGERVEKIHNQIYLFKKYPLMSFKLLLFAMVLHLMSPVCFYFVGKAFGLSLPVFMYFILIPIVLIVAFIPITVVGLGTAQAMGVFLFFQVGVDKATALGVFLMMSFFYIMLGLCGGVFYVAFHSRWLQSNK